MTDLEPRPLKHSRGLHIGQHRPGRRAFDPRIVGAEHAADRRIGDAPRHIGADRHRAGQRQHLRAGQPPQGVRRAVVAQLREQPRPHQPIGDITPAERREQRLRAPDRLPARRGHRADSGAIGREHARDPDVDRPRGGEQPRTGQPAHRQIDAPGRRAAVARLIAQRPRCAAAQREPGISDVEDRQRHLRHGRIERRGGVAEPPREFRLAPREGQLGRREPPHIAVASDHRRRGELERAAIDRALGGDAIAVRGHRDHALDRIAAPARARDLRADLAAVAVELRAPREARDR